MDTHRKNSATSFISLFHPEPVCPGGKWLVACFFVLALWLPPPPLQAADQAVAGLFANLEKRLIEAGFDGAEIAELYKRPEVTFDHAGVTAYFRHREATLNYDQFLSQTSIKESRDYGERHQKALGRARQRYGVRPEIIVAILLVESRLGTYRGQRLIFNTLSNLAAVGDPAIRDMLWETYVREKAPESKKDFDAWAQRKSTWAFRELQAYLQYVKAQGVDPFSMRGSFAGALGFSQFVPTSVLKYGRDGNDDGRIDLYEHYDAIESVANYLKQHGWKEGLSREEAYQVILRYNYSKYYANTILDVADRIAAP